NPTQEAKIHAEKPPTPDIQSMMRDNKGSEKNAAGDAFYTSVANIESRTHRLTLPSDFKMALRPKKTRGETVKAHLALHFGDAESLKNLSFEADATGQMLMLGTKNHSRQEIQDTIDRLQAMVNVSGSSTGASAYIETKRENLEEILRLVAEILMEPSFPEKEFEPMRQQWLASLEQDSSDPEALAIVGIRKHLNPYPESSVLYVPSIEEEIAAVQALELQDIRDFYSKFYGGSKIEISLVGDFDEDRMITIVKELFGSWESPQEFQRIPRRYFDVDPVNRSIETPDKQNAMFLAGLNLPLTDNDPDYPALVLANYMLGGGFLNSRLATRIRQQEGLSYGVGSQFSASPLDNTGTWLMYAYTAPQNIEKLEVVFKEEMVRALENGFSAEEIEAAKSGYLQSRQNSRAEDDALVSKLTDYLFLGRTLQWDGELEESIRALKPDQILQAMRRHIDVDRLTIIKAGDFKNTVASDQSSVCHAKRFLF
ncbi:MAG: pitrilysin family protein, partial [Acidobacteriota bacterium]